MVILLTPSSISRNKVTRFVSEIWAAFLLCSGRGLVFDSIQLDCAQKVLALLRQFFNESLSRQVGAVGMRYSNEKKILHHNFVHVDRSGSTNPTLLEACPGTEALVAGEARGRGRALAFWNHCDFLQRCEIQCTARLTL